jgi:Fe-S cluster biogenesis protein NfuA
MVAGMSDPVVNREAVIVKLIMLIGACQTPSITKRQIAQSIEQYIKELKK